VRGSDLVASARDRPSLLTQSGDRCRQGAALEGGVAQQRHQSRVGDRWPVFVVDHSGGGVPMNDDSSARREPVHRSLCIRTIDISKKSACSAGVQGTVPHQNQLPRGHPVNPAPWRSLFPWALPKSAFQRGQEIAPFAERVSAPAVQGYLSRCVRPRTTRRKRSERTARPEKLLQSAIG
jgi:hypothetical protein